MKMANKNGASWYAKSLKAQAKAAELPQNKSTSCSNNIKEMKSSINIVKDPHQCAQKQPFRVVLVKRCFEIMQQIYRRTTLPKCDFNKVALKIY